MHTLNPQPHPQSRPRSWRWIVAAALAVILLAGLGVKLWLDHAVPSPNADPGRLAHYMASPAFAALPDERKAPYLDAFQRACDRGQLTPEQQQGVISNLGNRTGKNPIRQYFSLRPGSEREKFLDDVIDRVLKSEKERQLPPPPDRKESGVLRFDRGRLADTIPPEDRARMSQFLQDLHDRRVARGLPDDGKFLFNRTP